MDTSRIYLDNNATTAMLQDVVDAVQFSWQNAYGNPGSRHSFGRDARRILEDGRENIAEILGADPSELIFTSGGTESVHLAVHGLTFGRTGTIALTAGEHPCVRQSCEQAHQAGMRLITLEVDRNGRLREEQFDELPWNELRLVCVLLAHNETGVIQDVRRLSELCLRNRVPLFLDAVQAVGKIPVDFSQLQPAALAFAAHKFHGPRGIGGLLLRRDIRLKPLFEGGHQEGGRRAGTENVALISGMSTALTLWKQSIDAQSADIDAMRDRFETLIRNSIPSVQIHGRDAPRLPNTSCIGFPNVSGDALLVNLDLAGVAASLGSACASGSAEPAPGLLAMGVPATLCRSSLRFSLSRLNTMQEIDEAAARIVTVVRRMQGGG
jgi:cysteine desulfurase